MKTLPILTAVLLPLCAAPAGGGPARADPPVVRVVNATDSDVYFWANDAFLGRTGARRAAEIRPDPEVFRVPAAGGRIAVTGLSEAGGVYQMNSVVIAAEGAQQLDIVWGGVDAPADLPAAAADGPAPPELASLFQARWATLKDHPSGAPFRFADTMIGSTWNEAGIERRVEGQTLTVRGAQRCFISNPSGMLLVRVPNGRFTVAQAGGPAGRAVTISRDFFMAVTETTRGQAAHASGRPLEPQDTAELPEVWVTWQQAVDLCAVLAEVDGWAYRLPTEAQWEYACQAERLAPFSPPGEPVDRIMWHSGNSGMSAQPVARLLPNAFGLYDMHGNVREWCRDRWGRYPPAGVDPTGPRTGRQRVRRGGAYDTPSNWCTCGRRDAGPPDIAQPWLGFRVVLERK